MQNTIGEYKAISWIESKLLLELPDMLTKKVGEWEYGIYCAAQVLIHAAG